MQVPGSPGRAAEESQRRPDTDAGDAVVWRLIDWKVSKEKRRLLTSRFDSSPACFAEVGGAWTRGKRI